VTTLFSSICVHATLHAYVVLKRSIPIAQEIQQFRWEENKWCLVKQSLFVKIFVWDKSRGYNVNTDKYECMVATCIP